METIEKAQNRLEITIEGKNGFYRGVLWSQRFINVEDALPDTTHEAINLSKVVICKSPFLADEFSAYYETKKKRWCLYPSGKTIQVTEWRPVERV